MENTLFIRKTYRERLLPVALSVLLVQLCSIINNLFAGGAAGGDGLAVMSAINPVYMIFATLGALLSMGGSTLAAHRIGKNDRSGMDDAFTLSLVIMLAAGALVTLLGLLGVNAVMRVLGVPEELAPLVKSYLLFYIPGSTAVMGIYIPFNYLKLVGKQNLSAKLFFIMAALDAALDFLFVKALRMGVPGIALSTSISFWTVFIIGTLSLCGKNGQFRLRLSKNAARDILPLMRLGSPSAVNNLCSVLRNLSLNHILVAFLGKSGLTAFGVIATVTSFSMAVSNGATLNMAPFAGVFSGEKDCESQRQLARCAMKWGVLLMSVYVALVLIFTRQICAIFSVTDPALLASAAPAVRRFAVSLLPAVVNYLIIGFYQSSGRTELSNLLTVLRGFTAPAGLALALASLAGPGALWYAFLAAELLTLAAELLYSRAYCKKHEHVAGIMLIDTTAEDAGKYIAFSVPADNGEAALSAERITEFCEQNDLSPKATMTIGLAIEEILVSLNENVLVGLPEEAARSNVRVLIYNDIVILRFRCGGRVFDPIAAAESEDDEFSAGMGIKMIQKMAQTVVYSNTFGVNNLTITCEAVRSKA